MHMHHCARESPLKCFPCYLLPSASLKNGTTPRKILDVLWHFPRQFFFKLERVSFIGWHHLLGFFLMPSSCCGIHAGIKVQAAASSQMSQGSVHMSQRGDTLWLQLPQPFHKLLPDNCQLRSANTISSLIKSLIKPVSDLIFIPPSICVNFHR